MGIQNLLTDNVGGATLPWRDLGIVDASASAARGRRSARVNAREDQLGWRSCIGIHDVSYWRARCGGGGKCRYCVCGTEKPNRKGDLVQGRLPSGVAANVNVSGGVRRVFVGTVKSANVHGRRR